MYVHSRPGKDTAEAPIESRQGTPMALVLYAVGTCLAGLLVPLMRVHSRQARADRVAWTQWQDAPDPVTRKAAARELTITAVARYAKTDELCDELIEDLTRFG